MKFNLIPTNIKESKEYATILAGSALVPKAYQGKPQDVFVAMQWGVAIGMHPLQALQNLAVINGRPSLWGDAALAVAQAHKDFMSIQEDVEESEKGMIATCVIKRINRHDNDNPQICTTTFSTDDAKKAGLWGKQGPWTQYPKRMLQMRARAFALRNMFADALMGIGVAEEVRDIPLDVTPASKTDKMLGQLEQKEVMPAVIENTFEEPAVALPETEEQPNE